MTKDKNFPKLCGLFVDLIYSYLPMKKKLKIADIGSREVGENCPDFGDFFTATKWTYVGLDLEAGKNVDIVVDPYNWPIRHGEFDVVISNQCIEHVEDLWKWIKEVDRICKRGGLLFITAPWKFKEHRFPVDCWRILPDGLRFLLTKVSRFDVLECYVKDTWTFAVGRKRWKN